MNPLLVRAEINTWIARHGRPEKIIHGAARGVDSVVDSHAKALGIPVDPYPADWNTHGKAAGPIRNRQMAREATHALVIHWGSPGSEDMVQAAAGLDLTEVRVPKEDPIWVSATQIDKFRTCPRLWGWEKLERVPREGEKGAARVGQRVHEIAESWLLKRTPPDLEEIITYPREDRFAKPDSPPVVRHPGRIFHEGMIYLPTLPPDQLEVEREFKIAIRGSRGAPAVLIGKVDLRYPHEDGSFVTFDHKTTSDLDAYLKPVEVLSKDVQALIYAAAESVRTGPGPKRMRWVYYQTKPSKSGRYKARPVDLVIDTASPEVQADLRSIEETIQNMADARALYRAGRLKVLDLPPVASACDKYLGCPHAGRCNLTPEETLKGAFETMTQNIDPQIASLLAGIAGPQPVGFQKIEIPDVPAAPPPLPEAPHDARAAALADGWQPHPSAPERAAWRGSESKTWAEVVAMYPPPPPPPVVPALPPIPPPPPVPDIPAAPPVPAAPPLPEPRPVTPELIPQIVDLYSKGQDPSAISIALGGLSVSGVKAAIANLQVNAPEAPAPDAPPPVAPTPTVQAPSGDRSTWGRDEWKALAMSLGLVDSGSRLGLDALRKTVEKHEAGGGTAGADEHPHAEVLAALTRIRQDLAKLERAVEALTR